MPFLRSAPQCGKVARGIRNLINSVLDFHDVPLLSFDEVKISPLLSLLALAGLATAIISCTHAAPPSDRVQAASAVRKAEESARPEIALVPLPSKSRYLTVHTRDSWENPFVTVQADTLLVRITHEDANPSPAGPGGLLRPAGARRQSLTISLNELPRALAALPESAWPYGRVVAIEETPASTPALRPKIRRNVEQTIQVLSELGIVIDEWSEPNPRGNR